jgi:hypothetical protein
LRLADGHNEPNGARGVQITRGNVLMDDQMSFW